MSVRQQSARLKVSIVFRIQQRDEGFSKALQGLGGKAAIAEAGESSSSESSVTFTRNIANSSY